MTVRRSPPGFRPVRLNEDELYDMRQFLVGSPGLMPKDMQWRAEKEHANRVHQKHGLGMRDFELLSADWCTKYVNARRWVERMLEGTRSEMVNFVEDHLGVHMVVELPEARLPPVSQ